MIDYKSEYTLFVEVTRKEGVKAIIDRELGHINEHGCRLEEDRRRVHLQFPRG